MYYPNFQDYMTMTHGKSFKLQQISVKTPGHRVSTSHLSSSSRVATTPPSNSNFSGSEYTDSITVGSDHSNSQSPPPIPPPPRGGGGGGGAPSSNEPNSLEVSYNSTASGFSNVRINRPDYQYESQELEHSREFRSPISPGPNEFGSLDQFEEYSGPSAVAAAYGRYEGGVVNGGRGHARNGSLDDTSTMLKQLRSGGEAMWFFYLMTLYLIMECPHGHVFHSTWRL